MTKLQMFRYGIWGLIVAIIVVVGAASLGVLPGRTDKSAGPGGTEIGAPFTLTSTTGGVYKWGETGTDPDKAHAIFFGFTLCPEVCPTTLFELTNWMAELGEDSEKIRPLFITIDPERDTAEVLADYISPFDKRIVGLTGTPEEIAAVANAFRVYAAKVPLEGGDYTMDHSASVLLFRADGSLFGTITYGEDSAVAAEKLKRLANS